MVYTTIEAGEKRVIEIYIASSNPLTSSLPINIAHLKPDNSKRNNFKVRIRMTDKPLWAASV